jgi:hypothetical protein
MKIVPYSFSRFQKTIPLCFMAILILLLYSFALDSGFVLDDKNNIEKNPAVHLTSLTTDSLSSAAFKSVLPSRPVANISFGLNYFFTGNSVRAYRLVNILLHIGTGILLYFFVQAILDLPTLKSRHGIPGWIPLAVAFLWLVHPVQTQTVNYIVQRMTILATLFYILAFLLYIRARLTEKKVKKWLLLGGSLVAGFLGLGCKETVATLPFFIVLFEFYFFKDTNRVRSRNLLFGLAAVILIGCILVFFYLGANPFKYITNSFNNRNFTLGQRLLTECRVVVFYVSQLFFPHPARLNLEHDFPLSFSFAAPPATLLSLLFIVVLVALALFNAKKRPLFSFCVLWFFGNLLIESSVIGLEIIFEHRTYLPSMLVILLAVTWFDKFILGKRLQITILTITILIFSLWTFERNRTWADTAVLLADCVNKSPLKPRPHLNLGIELKNRGQLDDAILHYRQALLIKPNYAEAYYNLGNALSLKGDFKGATTNYFNALNLTPGDVDTHYNLGYTLAKLWQFDRAVYHYSEAIRLKPDFQKARQELTGLRRDIQKLKRKKQHQ